MGVPRRIWWARPRKLCALDRPGGGGRTHRAEARTADIAHLRASGVWLVVSTMQSRHNLADYERAGLSWHHVPVASCAEGEQALEELLPLLRRELRRRGAVAVHGDLHTDFAAAVCAAHLHAACGVHPADGLAAAAAAGLQVTLDAARLLGVDHEELALPSTAAEPRPLPGEARPAVTAMAAPGPPADGTARERALLPS